MTRYDYLSSIRSTLESLAAKGVAEQELRDLIVYEDILRLLSESLKMEYCVDYAAERYGSSVSSVWRVIRRMREGIYAQCKNLKGEKLA